MPLRTLFTSAELVISQDIDTRDVTVRVRDEHTMSDRHYVLPEHLLPALHEALTDFLDVHPELSDRTFARRVK